MYDYDSKPREYRIYGLQRSGTYFLEFFIRENLDIKCGNKGSGQFWKHNPKWPTEVILEKETFFPIYKNPYMWIESIITKPVDYVNRQVMFPAKEVGNKDEMVRGYNICNLAKQYVYWYNMWFVNLPSEYSIRSYPIKYEDLLTEGGKVRFIDEVSNRFNIAKRHPEKVITPNRVTLSDTFTKESAKKYINTEIKLLEKANIEALNFYLPDDMLSTLGYQRL